MTVLASYVDDGGTLMLELSVNMERCDRPGLPLDRERVFRGRRKAILRWGWGWGGGGHVSYVMRPSHVIEVLNGIA